VPVADAAKDFLRVLDLVERRREPAVLVRDGKPVATLNPVPSAALTCGELADRWPELDRLSPEEADAFADDLEESRASIPPLKQAWD
jgi:antitoxin (DNA-binding transcriptional repressor) of toxin-antitoxin stability system